MSAIALCATGLMAAHHPPRARAAVKEGRQFRVPMLRCLRLSSSHQYETALSGLLRGLGHLGQSCQSMGCYQALSDHATAIFPT